MTARRALITGGSRGIGRAVASELNVRGWSLFLVSEHAERVLAAAETMKGVVGTLAVDLGEGDVAAAAVAKAANEKVETLDLLVLAAGIFIEEPLSRVDTKSFRRNMAVNLEANVLLVRELLPLLRKGVRPRIVLIGSTAAYEPYPLVPTYGVAKWALRGFAVNLRRELMSERVGVTFISPGGTLTDMWDGEDLPANRLLEARDIGLAVAALTELSEQAVVDELVVRPILGDLHE